VAFFLGGNPDRPDRLWLPAAWAELARKLRHEANVSLLTVVPPKKLISGSGKEEAGSYHAFSKYFGEPLPLFDEPGLKQAAALLSHADLFVCPDGGLMHVAVAARVLTIGLFFGTDPKRWMAPVGWAQGIRAPDGTPASLTAESVYSVIKNRLVESNQITFR
jgi:ADP-heptose:LPS heptosyltransferase